MKDHVAMTYISGSCCLTGILMVLCGQLALGTILIIGSGLIAAANQKQTPST